MYHFRSAIVAVRMRESRRIETAWGAYAHVRVCRIMCAARGVKSAAYDLSKKKRGRL